MLHFFLELLAWFDVFNKYLEIERVFGIFYTFSGASYFCFVTKTICCHHHESPRVSAAGNPQFSVQNMF